MQSGRYVTLILGAADSFHWLVHIYETKGCKLAEMIDVKELQIDSIPIKTTFLLYFLCNLMS